MRFILNMSRTGKQTRKEVQGGLEAVFAGTGSFVTITDPREGKSVVVKFTKDEAERLDLFACECGHRANNHFQHAGKSSGCAHCKCMQYKPELRIGELL